MPSITAASVAETANRGNDVVVVLPDTVSCPLELLALSFVCLHHNGSCIVPCPISPVHSIANISKSCRPAWSISRAAFLDLCENAIGHEKKEPTVRLRVTHFQQFAGCAASQVEWGRPGGFL